MKLLIDSSYLIPALGIDIVEGWSNQDLLDLMSSDDYELAYCELSLFEIYTKAMKLLLKGEIEVRIERIQKGLHGILYSKKLLKELWWEHLFESEIILELKRMHNDSIDCMIFYISVVAHDCLATFDDTLITKVKNNQELLHWVEEVNPDFQVWMSDLKEPRMYLIERGGN